MIAVIDYGAGNVASVLRAARYLGFPAEYATTPECVSKAEKIILPGQGHFGAMMRALDERGMLSPLREALASSRDFFGICLGLQALYETSDEAPEKPGFGVLRGRVKRLQDVFKVPHVGWNELQVQRHTGILRGIATGTFVYFCHSYYGPVTGESSAVTEYGERFSAAVEAGNISAVQFHPEKSGEAGLQILRNFLEM